MKAYFLNLWDSVRASYWFVPSMLVSGAVILSFLMPTLDVAIVDSGDRLPESIRTTTETARAILSVMAGAMIGVTGTVFSITIVTLSLTSQQFGPRLLRRFMYDLPTQFTLGVFLSTGFYCLLLLRVIEHHDNEVVETPHLSVLMAVVLTVLSMAMLILFIHHVALLIQAPHVVADVASDLDDSIQRLFPERIGDAASEDNNFEPMPNEQLFERHKNIIATRSTHEGYIQAMDGDGIMDLAIRHNLVLRLRTRPGNFIAVDTPLADVTSIDDTPLNEDQSKRIADILNDTIIVGIRRTPRQDVECAINEIVEVAVRSLSPGINDPFTAINCIDRLGAALGRLAERRMPSSYRFDKDGALRVVALPLSFGCILDAAFSQIRQYGGDSVAVTIRLLEALLSIAEHICKPEDRDSVLLHAEMTLRLSDSFAEEYDRQAVESRFEQMKKVLSQATIAARC